MTELVAVVVCVNVVEKVEVAIVALAVEVPIELHDPPPPPEPQALPVALITPLASICKHCVEPGTEDGRVKLIFDPGAPAVRLVTLLLVEFAN